MEQQIRSIELELKNLGKEALKERLETYNRLMSTFEAMNGYAYESEITGVLKGLGFQESDFSKRTDTLSGGQKTRVFSRKTLTYTAGYFTANEAYQPPGFTLYFLA